MMQWMRGVKKVPGIEDPQSAYADEIDTSVMVDTANVIQIQREQKSAMEEVKDQMESSIREARELLGLPETP